MVNLNDVWSYLESKTFEQNLFRLLRNVIYAREEEKSKLLISKEFVAATSQFDLKYIVSIVSVCCLFKLCYLKTDRVFIPLSGFAV